MRKSKFLPHSLKKEHLAAQATLLRKIHFFLSFMIAFWVGYGLAWMSWPWWSCGFIWLGFLGHHAWDIYKEYKITLGQLYLRAQLEEKSGSRPVRKNGSGPY